MKLLASSLALSLIATAAALPACSTAPPRALPDNVSEAAYPQIEARGNLEGRVYFQKPVVRRGKDGTFHVSVPVRSNRQNAIEAQYRFLFFTQDGTPLTPQMDWRYIQLPGRAQVFLQGTSLSKDATDWRLQIRPFE